MRHVEDRIRDALQDPRRDLEPPADPCRWVIARVTARRQRRRAMVTASTVVAAVIAAAGLVLQQGRETASPGERLVAPPSATPSAVSPVIYDSMPLTLGGRVFDVPSGLQVDALTDLPYPRALATAGDQMLELLLPDNGLPYGSNRVAVEVAGRSATIDRSPTGLLQLQVPLGGARSLVVSGYLISEDILLAVAASGLD